VRPERHQLIVDHLLFNDPITKKTKPVSIVDSKNALPALNTNGRIGTSPHTKKALKVAAAIDHFSHSAILAGRRARATARPPLQWNLNAS
jgi:hypothetical protein